MDIIEAIDKRCSTRHFTSQNISDEDIITILKAGMKAPSAVNCREWEFIVVRDHETLKKMANANGRAATCLLEANVAILVCGNIDKAYVNEKSFWIIDCALAIENMCLVATSLGLGNVILGTYPTMSKVLGHKEIFSLPDHIIPHSIIALGYPQTNEFKERERYDESLIHYEKFKL